MILEIADVCTVYSGYRSQNKWGENVLQKGIGFILNTSLLLTQIITAVEQDYEKVLAMTKTF